MFEPLNKEELQQKKVQEENKPEDIIFYGTKDVARMLGCSIPTAREMMRRKDFPTIMIGHVMKVSAPAFKEWAMKRRV